MGDHYEINIAKNGKHWARVIVPDWYPESTVVGKLQYLRSIFGDEFDIKMTYWTARGISKPEWD